MIRFFFFLKFPNEYLYYVVYGKKYPTPTNYSVKQINLEENKKINHSA